MNALGIIATLLVFGCVVALAYSALSLPGAISAQRLQKRLMALKEVEHFELSDTAIRSRYLRQLPPLERLLEQLPGMRELGELSIQAGRTEPAYRIVVLSLVLGTVGAFLGYALTKSNLLIPVFFLGLASIPLIRLESSRRARLRQIEDQLPDALDLMSRALRAGNPLMESFKFISDEMKPPIAAECGLVASHINYGVSLNTALMDLVTRVPVVSMRTLATAILVQRETGGNLAEVLDRLSSVMRSRAKFDRRVRTLSAEGRMSAMVLIIIPFALAGVLAISSPTYLPIMINDPLGHKLIISAGVLMVFGIFWISKIVRVRV